jgi:hypothetical protein
VYVTKFQACLLDHKYTSVLCVCVELSTCAKQEPDFNNTNKLMPPFNYRSGCVRARCGGRITLDNGDVEKISQTSFPGQYSGSLLPELTWLKTK